jgi:hypothetical protein
VNRLQINQKTYGIFVRISALLVSSILPKNELENVNFCPCLLGQNFFVRFLGELKKPKSPFEIN